MEPRPEGSRFTSHRWFVPALLAGAALLLRFLYLREFQGNPFFDYPIIDAAEYFGWAKRIAAGDWLWRHAQIHGPLFPYLLALLLKGGLSFSGIYIVQHLLGTATLLLLYDTGRIVGGRTLGLVAAAIALLHPRFVYFEGLLLATTLVTFLDTLLLRVAVGLGGRNARPRTWVLPGAIAGLSAITRPTILIALPALLFWAWRSGGRGAASRRALFLATGLLAVAGPVFLQNVRIGDPVLLQANGGMNFYIANRSGADGLASIRPVIAWKRIERLAEGAGMKRESDRDRFYYRLALREMAARPFEAIGRVMKRFLLFWGGREVDTSQDFLFFRGSSSVLRAMPVAAGAILPLAVIGLFAALRSFRTTGLPLLLLLSHMMAVLLFPYASRYRMPLLPVIALFAALGLLHVRRSIQAGPLAWYKAAPLPLLFVALNLFPRGLPDRIVRPHLHLGKMRYDRGDPEAALEEFDLSLGRNPDDPDLWNNIGLAREAAGDEEGARRGYERAIAVAADHAMARANLAGIFFRNGAIDSSLAEMKRAITLEPTNAGFRNNLGALLMRKGRMKEAVETLEAGYVLSPENRELLYNLGRAYERTNRFEDARRTYRALAVIGETPQVRLRLAYVAEKLGRRDEAEWEYRRALAIDPLFGDAMRGLGVLLLRAGRNEEGLRLLERYLERRPLDGRIRMIVEGERRR